MTIELGIIGVGAFAEHLIEGFMRADPPPALILSPRNAQRSRRMARRHRLPVAVDNDELVSRSDIVLLATRPVHALDSVQGLPWRADQIVISVAAGISRGELQQRVSPAEVVLSMPTNSGAIGRAAIPMHPGNATAERVLSMLGETFVIDDETVYEAAATLGAYYGWLLALMDETTGWLESKGMDAPQARRLLSQVFRSAADVVDHRSHESLASLVDELRTPGGLTVHGLDAFEETKAIKMWSNVVAAVHARLSRRY